MLNLFQMAAQLFAVFCALAAFTQALPIEEQKIDNIWAPELNPDLFEGDIMLTPEEANGPKNALLDPNRKWPNAIVPYVIADNQYNSTELEKLASAFAEYDAKTCIRFIPRTTERDYVSIRQTGGGCSSYVGRIGGSQQISLDSACFRTFGTPIHEMMHAAGFYHEQSRTDRNDWVYVNFDNIQPGRENNFNFYDESVIQTLGAEYDYGSVMHYGPYGFAIDPRVATIFVRTPGAEIGQRVAFSQTDLFKLNTLYDCPQAKMN